MCVHFGRRCLEGHSITARSGRMSTMKHLYHTHQAFACSLWCNLAECPAASQPAGHSMRRDKSAPLVICPWQRSVMTCLFTMPHCQKKVHRVRQDPRWQFESTVSATLTVRAACAGTTAHRERRQGLAALPARRCGRLSQNTICWRARAAHPAGRPQHARPHRAPPRPPH